MARACPVDLDLARLRAEVRETYSRVAADPTGDFHFHRGPDYAAELLGYDRAELDALPATATVSFAGVGNPHRVGPIEPGEVVLDIGSGAGTDALIAAIRGAGQVIGVEPTPAMRARAERAAAEAGVADRVEFRDGDTQALPAADASVDLVISNGVLNLSPDKDVAFAEIARVLRPGGRLYLADVAVARELSLDARADVDLWAA